MHGSKPEWPFDSMSKLNCLSSSFAASLFHRGALLAGIECESTKGQSTAAVARSVLPFLLPWGLLPKFDFLRDTVTKKFKSRVLKEEASVVMKENKKTKIKTFSAEYARSA